MPEDSIRRQLGVRWHHQKLLSDKPPRRAIQQVVQDRLVGLGYRAPQTIYAEGPYRVSCAASPTFQLDGLVKIPNTNTRRELLLTKANRATSRSRGLLCHFHGLDGVIGFLASQPGWFIIQRGHNGG